MVKVQKTEDRAIRLRLSQFFSNLKQYNSEAYQSRYINEPFEFDGRYVVAKKGLDGKIRRRVFPNGATIAEVLECIQYYKGHIQTRKRRHICRIVRHDGSVKLRYCYIPI